MCSGRLAADVDTETKKNSRFVSIAHIVSRRKTRTAARSELAREPRSSSVESVAPLPRAWLVPGSVLDKHATNQASIHSSGLDQEETC